MTDLLLLGRGAEGNDDLAAIFQNAGYNVVEVKDIVSCCRQLQSELQQAQLRQIPMQGTPQPSHTHRDVTIFNAKAIASDASSASRMDQLRQCIVHLARQLTPGWRLSMRSRRLEAPGGGQIGLTSLEFIFIKNFAMVEVGEPVSRKQIVMAFGEDYLSYDQNRIDTMVRRLRQKIETRIGIKLPLNTERVRGYSFGDVLILDH